VHTCLLRKKDYTSEEKPETWKEISARYTDEEIDRLLATGGIEEVLRAHAVLRLVFRVVCFASVGSSLHPGAALEQEKRGHALRGQRPVVQDHDEH
jgi:hypothetical protein